MEATLDAISSRRRTLLTMHYVEGMVAADIAATLDSSLISIESALSRAGMAVIGRPRRPRAHHLEAGEQCPGIIDEGVWQASVNSASRQLPAMSPRSNRSRPIPPVGLSPPPAAKQSVGARQHGP